MYKATWDFSDNAILLTKDDENDFEKFYLEEATVYCIVGGLECYLDNPDIEYATKLFQKHLDNMKKQLESVEVIEDYD